MPIPELGGAEHADKLGWLAGFFAFVTVLLGGWRKGRSILREDDRVDRERSTRVEGYEDLVASLRRRIHDDETREAWMVRRIQVLEQSMLRAGVMIPEREPDPISDE